MKIQPNQQRARGFTIIEILVAIAIFSGVLLSIYASWTAILKSREIGERAAVSAQRKRIATQAVEQALSSMVMFAENIPFYAFESDTSGDFAAVSFVARLPESFPGSGLFPGQPLRRVSFFVEKDNVRNNLLVMTQAPVLQVMEDNEEPYAIILAKDLNRFQLEFWDAEAEERVEEWPLTNQVPPLVWATLGFGSVRAGRNSPAQSLAEVTVAVPSIVIPREYQIPSNQGLAGLNSLQGRNANALNPGATGGGFGGAQSAQNGRFPSQSPAFTRGQGAFYDPGRLNFSGSGGAQGGAAAAAQAAAEAARYRRSNPFSRDFIENIRTNRTNGRR